MSQAILDKNNVAVNAGKIIIFNFDASTREYLSSSVEYLATGVGLPANSCTDIPLKSKSGYAVCRSSDFKKWEYVVDHRGEIVYSIKTREGLSVSELGDYSTNTTIIEPQTVYDKWDGKQWATDTNAQFTANIKIAEKKKSHLLQAAQSTISLWQTELQLEIINDEDKASLIAWLAYIKALKNVDISTLPDINWPELPSN